MFIQKVSSHNLYNSYLNNNKTNHQNKNQVSFGVGEDYGAEDDVFNKMEERSNAKYAYAELGDDTTYWELLFGPKKIKYPIDKSKLESLKEDPIDSLEEEPPIDYEAEEYYD